MYSAVQTNYNSTVKSESQHAVHYKVQYKLVEMHFNKKYILETLNLTTDSDRSTNIKKISGKTPRFEGSRSCSTNAPVHKSSTSHTWTFHGCNLEHLLVFKALCVGQ